MSASSRPKSIPKRSLASLRRRLHQRRSTLMEQIQRRLRAQQRVSNGHVSDAADMASTEADDGVAFAFTEAESGELAEVDDALNRVDSGEYGRCEQCGGLIGLERLKALPFAGLCLDCKQQEETAVGARTLPLAKSRQLRDVAGLWDDNERGAAMNVYQMPTGDATAGTS